MSKRLDRGIGSHPDQRNGPKIPPDFAFRAVILTALLTLAGAGTTSAAKSHETDPAASIVVCDELIQGQRFQPDWQIRQVTLSPIDLFCERSILEDPALLKRAQKLFAVLYPAIKIQQNTVPDFISSILAVRSGGGIELKSFSKKD